MLKCLTFNKMVNGFVTGFIFLPVLLVLIFVLDAGKLYFCSSSFDPMFDKVH